MNRARLPSVDRLLQAPELQRLVAERGRRRVVDAIRQVLADARAGLGPPGAPDSPAGWAEQVRERVGTDAPPGPRRVFNLTGTVVHTNLGRAPLPEVAIEALVRTAGHPVDLEFDLERGARGDRTAHVESLLCRLTGAGAAAVVNNNAAAVLLVLNTLALGREVPTSRGELIEIGGSFRMPDIMRRAGCRLREVGTTNRVHLSDYDEAIGPRTGLVMKVHTSNYALVGFTSSVPEAELAALCRARGVPFAVDLGSGMLVDLRAWGLPYEPTAGASLRQGADLVTFSGDKLLGGPQAGLIVGRRDLVARIRANPLARALRVDKLTIAALASVLALYADPDRLVRELPVLRLLTRPLGDIQETASRLQPHVAAAVGERASVAVVECRSEIGSGALPTQTIASAGLALAPSGPRRASGTALKALAAALRALPIPVLGRIHQGTLVLDLRCLEAGDEPAFVEQMTHLARTWR